MWWMVPVRAVVDYVAATVSGTSDIRNIGANGRYRPRHLGAQLPSQRADQAAAQRLAGRRIKARRQANAVVANRYNHRVLVGPRHPHPDRTIGAVGIGIFGPTRIARAAAK